MVQLDFTPRKSLRDEGITKLVGEGLSAQSMRLTIEHTKGDKKPIIIELRDSKWYGDVRSKFATDAEVYFTTRVVIELEREVGGIVLSMVEEIIKDQERKHAEEIRLRQQQLQQEEEEQDFHFVHDVFIVSGSGNGTFGVYEERGSNVFEPYEEITLYVEYAGITQKPKLNTAGNTTYLTNKTGNFTITDKQGNIVDTANRFGQFDPFDTRIEDSRLANYSDIFIYRSEYPPLDPGEYILTFTLTDNLSKQRIELAKDIVIIE